LTSLITALTAKFWNNKPDQLFINTLCSVGPFAYFEGYLSLYGNEWDFWSDMNVAVEDLSAVNFSLVCQKNEIEPIPQITGSRQALFVRIPIPERIFEMLPETLPESFKVTVVFFNIGINEKATLAETLGYCKEQARSNLDNFEKLKIYFMQYRKVKCTDKNFQTKVVKVQNLLHKMEQELKTNTQKNIEILSCAQEVSRLINGLRFTSCKSAKDRTSMAGERNFTRHLSTMNSFLKFQ
jgi:inositol polyphosphate-4-phosphatase